MPTAFRLFSLVSNDLNLKQVNQPLKPKKWAPRPLQTHTMRWKCIRDETSVVQNITDLTTWTWYQEYMYICPHVSGLHMYTNTHDSWAIGVTTRAWLDSIPYTWRKTLSARDCTDCMSTSVTCMQSHMCMTDGDLTFLGCPHTMDTLCKCRSDLCRQACLHFQLFMSVTDPGSGVTCEACIKFRETKRHRLQKFANCCQRSTNHRIHVHNHIQLVSSLLGSKAL